MRKLRIFAWVMILGIVGMVLIMLSEGAMPQKRSPIELETKMASLDGSLYDSTTGRFGIKDFAFGRSFPETVQDLGLHVWFPEDRIESIVDDMSSAEGECTTGFGDSFTFSAFGGKEYKIAFEFSRSLKCYMLDFSASFIDPELAAQPPLSLYKDQNALSYEDSCRYFNEMVDAFVTAYGAPIEDCLTPDLINITTSDLKDGSRDSSYAVWVSEDDEGTSVLRLSATPYLNIYSDDTLLDLVIRVQVGQTAADVSLEDLHNSMI